MRCLFWRVPFAEPGVEAHAGNCPHHVCIVEARRRKVAEKVQRGPGHAEQAAQEDGASHGGVTVVSVARTMVRATETTVTPPCEAPSSWAACSACPGPRWTFSATFRRRASTIQTWCGQLPACASTPGSANGTRQNKQRTMRLVEDASSFRPISALREGRRSRRPWPPAAAFACRRCASHAHHAVTSACHRLIGVAYATRPPLRDAGRQDLRRQPPRQVAGQSVLIILCS